MSRQTLQCVGTSTKGRSESKGSLATQLDAVCAGEPASNESVHNRSRPTARPIPKAAGEDQRASKRTATRSPKAKLNGTGEHAISPVQLHKDETENGCGTVKQPGSKVQPQSPVLAGSACDAGAPRLACPALRPSAVSEESEEQGGAAGAPLASRPVRGMCPRSGDTSDFQAGLQRDQSPSEEEEEECGDEDERPARDAPLELLAEFLRAVMAKDYPLSQKLCQMILIYEPENPEAKLFLPLIEERLLMAQEAAEQREKEEGTGSSGGEEEEHNDDDDDDDDDTSEWQTDSSESSLSSSSSEEDTDEEEEEEEERKISEEHERCKRAAVIP